MFQPASVIAGRYQVVRLVGQGGMSNLYLAYDRKYNNATVVVKEMTASYSDPKEQQMAVDLFHREAKLLASLNHRHIPKVFDYFQFAGKYYLSMEYIDGCDLAVKLDETKGPLPEEQVLEWGEQIATVLFYLHSHDPPIVFRDVKPSNIMISSRGVKLIDFGIARHFDQAKKGDTMRIGSPGYAPPEQYAAQTDPRSDIYALGVTLHHAVTGRDPTATSTPFLVPPARDLNPKVSEATAAMLARATQLDPSDRYQSALEMKKDILHILQRNKQSTRVVGAPPALPTATSDAKTTGADKKASPADAKAAAATTAPKIDPNAAPATAASATPASAGSTPDPDAATAAPIGAQAAPTSATGSGALQTPATPAAPKKRRSVARLLLAACFFVAAAGLAAFLLSPPESQALITERVTSALRSAQEPFARGDHLEDELRRSLLSANPEALLPLFHSSEFRALSLEKQELFRLNLLAGGSAHGDLHIVHLIVPESRTDDREIWQTATAALGALNGGGGIDSSLFAIIPQTYQEGGLAAALTRAAQAPVESPALSFLVLDSDGEELPETVPAGTYLFTSQDSHAQHRIEPLDDKAYQEIYQLDLNSASEPIVWGLPTPAPDSTIEMADAVNKLPEASSLSELLDRSSEAGATLLIRAVDAIHLGDSQAETKVRLLAISAESLPPLGPNLQGEALVLSSPFNIVAIGTLSPRPPAGEEMTLSQARFFDALIASAIEGKRAFDGLTVGLSKEGSVTLKQPISYHWNGDAWLPSRGDKGNAP